MADFEQVQAERLDFGQHAVQCRPVRRPVSTVRAVLPRRQRRERQTQASQAAVPPR